MLLLEPPVLMQVGTGNSLCGFITVVYCLLPGATLCNG